MFDDFCRGLFADEGRELFNAGFRDLMNRSELTKQASLAFLSHAGNRRQLRSEVAQFAALAMISDRIAMRFVANHLNQTQDLRVRIEIDGFVFAAFDQKVSDLVVMKRRLNHADHRHSFQIEFAHRIGRSAELSFPAVNHDQVRQRLLFITDAAVTTQYGFVHRSEIVRPVDGLDLEFAILVLVHLSVFANDHAGHIIGALNVRDIEGLDPGGESRQFQRLLHLFQHALHVGLEHAKALFESELRILLNQIDHVALLTALRSLDVHAPALAFSERSFQ